MTLGWHHLKWVIWPEVTWGDKGREGVKNAEILDDTICGWSLRDKILFLKNVYSWIEFPSFIRAMDPLDYNFLLGEIVAARNEGKWFRARIIEVLNEDAEAEEYSNDFVNCMEKVRVFFVDYGQASTLYMDSIREIKKSFLELPFQVNMFSYYSQKTF